MEETLTMQRYLLDFFPSNREVGAQDQDAFQLTESQDDAEENALNQAKALAAQCDCACPC